MATAISTTGKTLAFLPLLGVASPFAQAAEVPFPSLSPFPNQPDPMVTGSQAGQTAAIASPITPLADSMSVEASTPQFVAQVLPTDGATQTQVTVDAGGNQFEIRGGAQAGENLFHRFDQLDLEAGQTANFQTPAGLEAIFSQVGGGPSSIDGTLKVSGSSADLFLLNPQGVVFGPNARLDLNGSFTATTADRIQVGDQWVDLLEEGITAQTAVAGSVAALEFSADAAGGAIANQGQLAVTDSQSLGLLGNAVVNTGSLTAPGGEVTILSASGGQRVSLGGGLLNLDLAGAQAGATPGQSLPAAVAQPIAEATGLSLNADGSVSLQAGTSIVSGSVDVASANDVGGQVRILGDDVQVMDAVVDASGAAGGEIHVGGDYQGRGEMLRAVSTRLDAASVLRADGIASNSVIHPDGGEVVVWSDGTAEFAGTATAQSLAPGGEGGLVETSGKQQLNIASTANVNTTSVDGATGQWLIDPVDLTIVNGGGIGTIVGGVNDPGASTIDAATIEAGLNGNNVSLQADNSITVDAAIDASGNASGGDLNLDSPNLNLNERIILSSGSELFGTATTVNVGANGGIQNAVDAAVAGGTVNLAAATYREGAEVDIGKQIRLQGQGAANTTISGDANGDGNTAGNQADNHRVFNLDSSADGTVVSGIRVSDGIASSAGAGLTSFADDVTLEDSIFADNQVTGIEQDGGAVHTRGQRLAINNVRFENNYAQDDGGALDIEAGSVSISNSTFLDNVADGDGHGGAIDVDPNGSLIVTNTVFERNSARTDGGAIYAEGTASSQLNISRSTFENNDAQQDGGGLYLDVSAGALLSLDQNSFLNNSARDGGGLFKTNSADLNIANSLFESNTATDHGGGLAAENSSGMITLTDSNIVQNVAGIDGGGIRLSASDLSTSNSLILTNNATFGGGLELSNGSSALVDNILFQGNNSSSHGGAISIDDSSMATVTNSRFLNNQSGGRGGAINTHGSLSLDTSLVQANSALQQGGGIALQDSSSGAVLVRSTTVNSNVTSEDGGGLSHEGSQTLTIEDSTFSSNSAIGNGGGLDLNPTASRPQIQLQNSTISSNTSGFNGGGLSLGASAQVDLNNATVANNSAVNEGGGLANLFGGSLALQNTIVAGNTAASDPDVAGTITSLGNNIVRNRATSTGYVSSDLPDGTDPLLLSLANNGGLTETHAVQANSLAVNGGNAGATAADQRGLAAISQRDIGAYELDNALIFSVTGSGQNQTVNQAFSNPVGVTVTDSLGGLVAGLDIDVTAPATGASASLGTLQTDSSGVASTTAIANTVAGSYTVNLGISGNSSIGSLALSNRADLPDQIAVLNGDNQSTVVNTNFVNPLAFAVTDQFGNQLPGRVVTVSLPGSGASASATNGFDLNALNVMTDSAGQATIGLTANTIAGSYAVGLTSGSLSNGISLTNLPDVPSQLALLNGNNQSTVVNTTFSNPLQVEVTDQFGNAVPGVTVDVSLPGTGASANAGAIALTTDSLGQATTGLTANTIAGSYAVGLTAGAAANNLSLENLPDAPAQLTGGNSQSTVVNTAFANPLQVMVTDQFGNAVPGVVVGLSLPTMGATANPDAIALTTDATGQATAGLTANTIAGSYSLDLSAAGLTSAVALANLPDAPARLDVLDGDGQSTVVNTAFANPLQVEVQDQFGNVIPGVTVNFSTPAAVGSGEASAVLSPVAVSTDGAGQGQTLAIANNQAGLYQVQAQAGGLTAAFDLENQAPPVPPEPPVVVPPTPTPETPPVLEPPLPELPSGTDLPLASLPPSQPVENPSGSLPSANAPLSFVNTTAIQEIDSSFSSAYTNYWGQPESKGATVAETRALLKNAGEVYGVKSAVVYALFVPQDQADNESFGATQVASMALNSRSQTSEQRDDDQLMLVLVPDEGSPIQQLVDSATRREVLQQARLFRMAVSDPYDEWSYQPLAQQLYSWMLQPVEPELERLQLDNVMYVMDAGLRTLPLAAMMKGDEFAIERYGISLIPSVDLMETNFGASAPPSQIVAAGATEFKQLNDLPAVELELDAIASQVSPSNAQKNAVNVLFNEAFTQENLLQAQQQGQANMLHLATHGEFNAGDLGSSYLQFWDDQLTLDEISKLGWDDLELLILSACQTAISSPEAELGFAGLAAATGVESTIGSLWSVSDIGTLGLMSEFYGQLKQTPLRFEALRQAQLAMMRGQTRITDQNLQTGKGEIALPKDWNLPDEADFSHPFYWSGFTLVGNPWW